MNLPAIRERISQLPRPRRYLFLTLSILGTIFILIIVVETFYFIQSGFFRPRMIIKGPKIEIWSNGKKTNWVAGTVIEIQESKFVIENEDKRIEVEIVGNVFYCGDRKEGEETIKCEVIDASKIQT